MPIQETQNNRRPAIDNPRLLNSKEKETSTLTQSTTRTAYQSTKAKGIPSTQLNQSNLYWNTPLQESPLQEY